MDSSFQSSFLCCCDWLLESAENCLVFCLVVEEAHLYKEQAVLVSK